jgi:hypothetical protein
MPGRSETPGIAGSVTTGPGSGSGTVLGGTDPVDVDAPCGIDMPALTATATFAWLTGPSFPGLPIRIETFTLLG